MDRHLMRVSVEPPAPHRPGDKHSSSGSSSACREGALPPHTPQDPRSLTDGRPLLWSNERLCYLSVSRHLSGGRNTLQQHSGQQEARGAGDEALSFREVKRKHSQAMKPSAGEPGEAATLVACGRRGHPDVVLCKLYGGGGGRTDDEGGRGGEAR
ncbi:hypothetical protein E2C01_050551 [Portunus trituberculatus]|uniref:Uncharacterized protein n=1 Tax=Portunus trituberculatus TaxID=210409 RepID=A0A5B7GHA9_PORTR|nr:hypothetical protein [Portunus trituberculatus]